MTRQELTDYLDNLDMPSRDLIIYKDHKEIYRHFAGYFDKEKTRKIKGDEYYFIYSSTKVTTCTAALQLYERGIIDIDDPVSKYLPEYRGILVKDGDTVRPPKTTLTIRHLFSMTGGFDYDITAPAIKAAMDKDAGTREIVKAIAEKPLMFDPGTHFNYSLCHDVLAGVIEVASGMSYGEYLRKNIWEPLGMKNTSIRTPSAEILDKMPDQYEYNCRTKEIVPITKTCCYQFTKNYESGGAGIVSTVEDYILIADALASGGVGKNGARILKPETVELMREPQLSPDALLDFNKKCANKPGYSYAFGVRSHIDPEASHSKSSLREFGWDGAAGAYILMDPEHKLSIFYAEHVLLHGPSYEVIHPIIRDAAYDIMNES